MKKIVDIARSKNSGASRGDCFKYVANYIDWAGYGGIPTNFMYQGHARYAKGFAVVFDNPANQKAMGIKKLPITNPYDAPYGSIIVVSAGSPGTAHPVAGDIVVRGTGDEFLNDGPRMNYHGRAKWDPNCCQGTNANNKVSARRGQCGCMLGVYVPTKCSGKNGGSTARFKRVHDNDEKKFLRVKDSDNDDGLPAFEEAEKELAQKRMDNWEN